ncbi:F0F1 ATP synthase subunit delta [Maribius pontilimi]|uniref:ATP synthase subunit b n=1 Tax=Palleronia pontilimi TaxID=1964209 RepID=A0A934M911_9RHOB|nr:F0F1 ATP synthase subunit delta [Palleronia pontilimi]MBJ3762017.1 F0F1 ATP synthase subunit delta [Palleronia pontilimi]
MSIDWITVAAQIVNFLVLVWLLKRFLYRPILDGIDRREVEITQRMQEAAHVREQAQAMEQAYRDKVQALDVAQADLTETIRRKAEEQRDALLADARRKLEKEHETWRTHLDDEARKYKARLHRAGAASLLALTGKALDDLADETLEERMARHLAQKLGPMAQDLRRAAAKVSEAVVTSQGPLSQAGRQAVQSELQDVFPDISVRFETDEEQSPGLVLRMGGAEVAWTVETYLEGLASMIDAELVSGRDAPGAER